jgi:hypothetical protein
VAVQERPEQIDDEEIPEEGSRERIRLAASALHRRERQAFGGSIQWEAAFFGWLAAIGLAAILVAMVVGAGVAVGLTELDADAQTRVEELSLGGGALLVAILAIAYASGGYVAARMARFDGWRQGLGVWLLSLLLTVALAITAWIAGGDINPLESLELPRIPVEEGPLTRGGAIAMAIIALAALLAAIGGGVIGERFHRAVDRAGIEFGAPEPTEAEAELAEAETEPAEAETEADSEPPAEPATVADPEEEPPPDVGDEEVPASTEPFDPDGTAEPQPPRA